MIAPIKRVEVISNTLSCFSVKELSDAELRDGKEEEDSKLTLVETFKLLISNKYFVMICVVYILQQLRAAMLSVGTYFMTYVLFNQKLFGVFSWAINIPLIIALAITPTLVAKARGMYKLNKYSYVFATICRLGIVVAGYLGSIPLMLVFTVLTSLGEGPWQGDVGAVIANCSEHTYLKTGKRIDGSMFSCTSFGTKLGGGIGVALSGWLLDASGYVNNAAVQSASCISMMNVMYLWLPFAFDLIITIILSFMNIEGANEQLKESEITDGIIFYHNFLRRRRAYTFVDMGRLDDAEEAFKEMLNEDANKEYAKGELEYIQELKKRKSTES